MKDKNPKKFYKSKKKPIPQTDISMQIMSPLLLPYGAFSDRTFKFKCGHEVPIYEISNVHALNQLIGYAKFINRSYGNVYYRGECKLHDSLFPSIYRKNVNVSEERLVALLKKIAADDNMKKQLKLENDERNDRYKIEGMLQHYGIRTRFVDVVDNHWIALWMGLHKNVRNKQVLEYNHYEQREIPLVDFADGKKCTEEDLFQYVLLIAVPGQNKRVNNGIYIAKNFVEIDLRQALPSTYIRPHAQHGLVIRKCLQDGESPEKYDLAENVVGILKLRIDRVKEWIGSGELLTQDNLFPAPAYDNGYDILLSRTDLFSTSEFAIARYI